jgi:hypothetical protein
MADLLTNPLFFVLVGFILLLAVINLWRKVRRSNAWDKLAAETGMQLAKNHHGSYIDRTLSGIYRKRPIALEESTSSEFQQRKRDNGSQTDTLTTLRVSIEGLQGAHLRFNRIISIASEPELITGDEEIDRHFQVESQPDWLAKTVLTSPNIRQKITQLKIGGTVHMQETEIFFEQIGIVADEAYLRFLLDFLSDLADVVEKYR